MKRINCIFLVLVMITLHSTAQEKEGRAALEFSPGVSLATSKIAGAKLNPGMGFEAVFHYRILKHTGLYAGWGWNSLSAGNSIAGKNTGFEETGYVFGLQFRHPAGNSRISYYLRAGGLYNHIETENDHGDIVNDSKHGFGWQAAAGICYSLGRNWNLTPGVKFNSLSRNIRYGDFAGDLDLRYLSLRVGIMKVF